MSKIGVIIHCSDSEFGDVSLIDSWHKARGWSGVGYSFVICNSYPTGSSWKVKMPFASNDGKVQAGRKLDADSVLENDEVGAHAAGFNRNTIGICLIGKNHFTEKQFISAKELVLKLSKQFTFDLFKPSVRGHYEVNAGKTCPNINMNLFRDYLQDDKNLAVLVEKYSAKGK